MEYLKANSEDIMKKLTRLRGITGENLLRLLRNKT